MANERGFIELPFVPEIHEAVAKRITHFNEFIETLSDHDATIQASRCMDCGIPFCQNRCPLHNDMPDFNRAVAAGDWEQAYSVLIDHNDFPEITGRICPALCQESCCLGLYQDKEVGIKSIERKIIEYAYANGLVPQQQVAADSGKKVAIVGSGPAALACATSLNRLGVAVTVIEKMDKIGGLLRYGIPDFKLSKEVLDRKIKQMVSSGVRFITSTLVVGTTELKEQAQAGHDLLEKGIHTDHTQVVSLEELKREYDAVVLAVGSESPRDLPIPGRELEGIHFALDFLIAQNKENQVGSLNPIVVKGKKVVVIGGGETASDCIGVAIRKGAASVTQLDYHEELPESIDVRQVWPHPRHIKHTSTSQEEGCTRLFATNTTAFLAAEGSDKNGNASSAGNAGGAGSAGGAGGAGKHVAAVSTVQVKWGPNRKITPIKGTEGKLEADVVLIAMGYSHPAQKVFAAENKAFAQDARHNFKAELTGPQAFVSSDPKVFVTGDCRRGQSLVVYALAEGRDCALSVYQHMMRIEAHDATDTAKAITARSSSVA